MDFSGLLKAAAWLAVTFAYTRIFGGRIPFFIFYTAAALLAVGFFWSRLSTRVSAHCYTEAMTSQVGGKVKVVVDVKNNSGWPVPWMQYWVQMPRTFGLPDNLACYTFSLAPHERKVISEELECRQRGKFHWGNGLVRTGDLFGVFRSSRQTGELRELAVLPEVLDMGYNLGLITRQRFGEVPASLQTGRGGTSFIGVRKYDAGDGISRIHWKACARSRHLLVKEFQEQRMLEFCIYLDANSDNHAGSGPEGSFEKAVTLAASLAGTGTRSGYGIGLAAFGAERTAIPAGYGKSHFNLILQTLVQVQPGKGAGFGESLGNEVPLLKKNCHTFVITGHIDEPLMDALEWLKSQGINSTLFLLRLDSFSKLEVGADKPDKHISRLMGTGMQVFEVNCETDLRLMFRGFEYGVG